MAYACVRTDNMSGTVNGKDLVSVKYFEGENEAAIENGCVVLVGEYLEGQREVRKAMAPAANSKLSDVALIANEEVDKTKGHNNLNEYVNEAGMTIRGYRLVEPKQMFGVTKEAFAPSATPVKGAVVELMNGNKFNAAESATEGSTVVGKIVAVEGIWFVIELD